MRSQKENAEGYEQNRVLGYPMGQWEGGNLKWSHLCNEDWGNPPHGIDNIQIFISYN